MSNNIKKIDQQQVIRSVYDEIDNCLRVCVENSIADPVPVVVVSGGASTAKTNIYNEITSVGAATLTTILTYVVPPSQSFFFELAEVSGTNKSDYTIKIDGIKIARKYTYFTELSGTFNFDSVEVTTGQTIIIETIHSRPYIGDFSARILGVLI